MRKLRLLVMILLILLCFGCEHGGIRHQYWVNGTLVNTSATGGQIKIGMNMDEVTSIIGEFRLFDDITDSNINFFTTNNIRYTVWNVYGTYSNVYTFANDRLISYNGIEYWPYVNGIVK